MLFRSPIPKDLYLERVFSIINKADLRNDFTVQRDKKFYQVLEPIRAKEITVEERLDGRICLYHKDTLLKYKLIDKKPQKPKQLFRPRKIYTPPADHPWRKFKIKNCA